MDKLAERLSVLTVTRDWETVPEGLVDSIPPEGRHFEHDMFTYLPYVSSAIRIPVTDN